MFRIVVDQNADAFKNSLGTGQDFVYFLDFVLREDNWDDLKIEVPRKNNRLEIVRENTDENIDGFPI